MLSEIDVFREYAMTQSDMMLGEPATEGEIADFEAKYGVKFPADIREFFLKINGVYVDGGFIAIEPLGEWCLASEYGNYSPQYFIKYFREVLAEDADQYFHFGNYDISVWDWFIKLNANPEAETSIIVVHEKTTKIADSFTNFLQKYRTNAPESLLGYSNMDLEY